MDQKEAIAEMSREAVLHLVVYLMFQKSISLDELTATIREKEKEICPQVNDHLNKTL